MKQAESLQSVLKFVGTATQENAAQSAFLLFQLVHAYYRTGRILPRHSKNGVIIFFRASNARLFKIFRIFALPKPSYFSDPRGPVRVAKSKFCW